MAENNKGNAAKRLPTGAGQGPPATHTAAVLVYATFPDFEQAESTGRRLIEAGLAACINILPAMTSIYRWQGAIETAQEVVLIAKTVVARADAVTGLIVELHPYETPAVLVIPVVAGSLPYLQWIGRETSIAGG